LAAKFACGGVEGSLQSRQVASMALTGEDVQVGATDARVLHFHEDIGVADSGHVHGLQA